MRFFDEAGEHWMQTAGMFEIKGFAGGKPVFIAPGKSLTVTMTTEENGAYESWFFDAEAGNWNNVGTSVPETNTARESALQEYEILKKKFSSAPIPPAKVDAGKPSLDFNIDYKRFPELADKKGIVWQYHGDDDEKDPSKNKWIGEIKWEDMTLSKHETSDHYNLTLRADTIVYTIPVVAGLSGQSYEEAMAAYEEQMEVYKDWQSKMSNQLNFIQQQDNFVRSMRIQQFGIYNYDILLKSKESIPFAADFDFGDATANRVKGLVKVFLITKEGRTVISFPQRNWARFAFNPRLENELVAILPGNITAKFTSEDFKNNLDDLLNAKGNSYTFKMKSQQAIASLEELDQVLVDSGD